MALLETQGLVARYGDFQALFGVDIALDRGETVAIIGANGAGKTTLMRSISGLLASTPEQILHDGVPIGALSADSVMKRGIAVVPEGRKLFPSLSVEENLLIGGQERSRTKTENGYWNLETIYGLFPVLRERRTNPGTALSGGQQQMVAIGRALMSNPEILLCDEISLGLAPVVIKDIYQALPQIKQAGASVILVEQDIGQALRVADRVYCMMEGRITLEGRAHEVSREAIHDAYFGAAA
ncbi:MAG: ABC transporter ATP-binding protein [Geminicoccaceae bacterium]